MWAPVYCCAHCLRPRNSPPPPAFGLIYEGAIGQLRWTTSLCNTPSRLLHDVGYRIYSVISKLQYLHRINSDETSNFV